MRQLLLGFYVIVKAISIIFYNAHSNIFALTRRLLQFDCFFELEMGKVVLKFIEFCYSQLKLCDLLLLGHYLIVVPINSCVYVCHDVLLH